jgi:hypothetical protein
MTQLSLPLAGGTHAFCMTPADWAWKHVLCYVCKKLQKDCECDQFRCCSVPLTPR